MYAKGNLAAAEPLLREVLKVQRETLGSGHPDTLCSNRALSMLLIRRKLGSTYNYIASLCRSPHLARRPRAPGDRLLPAKLSDPLIAR